MLKERHVVFFFIVTALLCFAHNNCISLWDQDEAAYAAFARNMVNSGDWLTQNFMWSKAHRKPPLHLWNIAISYKIFGVNEFAVRFPSTIFILLTYLIIYFQGRKLFGQNTSFYGTVVLSTTFFVPSLAKVSVTDGTLLFFSTVCAFSILSILKNYRFIHIIIFWLSFSLALLTKGPPIIIFSVILIGILAIFHPQRKNLFKLHPWFFLPVAILPIIVWGYMSIQQDGGKLINWMIDWYILKRINGGVFGQVSPPGTHLLLITAFFIPYLMFFPQAIWQLVTSIFKDKNDKLLLGAWFVAGWLIYEFSPSKLPAYTVVAHVPLAILIGKLISENFDTHTLPRKGLVITQFSIFLLLTISLLVLSYIINFSNALTITLFILNILTATGIFLAIKKLKSKQFIYYVFGINITFHLIFNLFLLPQIDLVKGSSRKIANLIHHSAKPESTIILANKTGYPPSLPYYTFDFFDTVIESDNVDSLVGLYETERPYVFVLKQKQKDRFEEFHSNLEFQNIRSMISDRTDHSNYYILINNSGKKD